MVRRKVCLGVLLDVSSEMSHPAKASLKSGGERSTCLEVGKDIVQFIIANAMREGKASDEFHISLLGTDGTANDDFSEYGGCKNVTTMKHENEDDVTQADLRTVRLVENSPLTTQTSSLNEIDVGFGINVVSRWIEATTQKKKYLRRLIVVTNGRGITLNSLGKGEDLNPDIKIEVCVIETDSYPNNVDELIAWRPGGKMDYNVMNDTEMRKLLDSQRLGQPSLTSYYRGPMTFYRDMTQVLQFHVQGWTKTSKASAPPLKKVSKLALDDGNPDVRDSKTQAKVKTSTSYITNEGEKELPPDRIQDSFRYGKQMVPFEEEALDMAKFRTKKGIEIVGFQKEEEVPWTYNLAGSLCFEAQLLLPKSKKGFHAFVKGLKRKKYLAIARFVYRNDSKVKMLALYPFVSSDEKVVCLYSHELPFSQDLREYRFESIATKPEYQNTEDALKLIEEFVTRFDLSSGSGHSFIPEDTLNPYIERIYETLTRRAVDPEAPLPVGDHEPERIKKLYTPDQALFEANKPVLASLQSTFGFQRVEVEVKRKRGEEEDPTNIKEEPGQPPAKRNKEDEEDENNWVDGPDLVDSVGFTDPCGNFAKMLERRDKDMSDEALSQMQQVILTLIGEEKGGASFYPRALECLVGLRKGCVFKGKEDDFNEFLRSFKEKCTSCPAMWDLVIKQKLTLISDEETEISDVTKQEAEDFIKPENAPKADGKAVKGNVDLNLGDDDDDDDDDDFE